MSGTIQPNIFLLACRTARLRYGLTPTEKEAIDQALEAIKTYCCGCLWCSQLGDKSDRTPPGPRVLSAYCAAMRVSALLGEPLTSILIDRLPLTTLEMLAAEKKESHDQA